MTMGGILFVGKNRDIWLKVGEIRKVLEALRRLALKEKAA
jgi:hypothetical protein